MMRFYSVLAVVVLLVFTAPAFADGMDSGVTVRVNDTFELQYDERVRLSQVLSDAQSQWAAQEQLPALNVYWPDVRLVHVDRNNEIERKRNRLINRLDEVRFKLSSDRDDEKAVASLIQQIEEMPLGFQPYRQLNFERARQTLDANPLLAEGDYRLSLPERQRQFYMLGLTSQAGARHLEPGLTLRDYLRAERESGHLLPGYNRDYAHVIRPNQTTTKEPWAYHNATGTQLQPGNLVLVGFDRWHLPRGYQDLSDELTELVAHWVPDDSIPVINTQSPEPSVASQLMNHHDWQRQDYIPTRNNFGGVGLMQNPTARFAPEGEVSINYTDMDEYRRYSVNLSVLSWMEATAFYAQLPNRMFSPDPNFSNDNIYTDKGFDVKFRVWEESYYIPQIAIGLRDFAGTGLFDSEYIVANKRFGPFDVSLGLGFGRMGTRDHVSNPFCELVSDEFCDRREVYAWTGSGGKLEAGEWFSGPMAFFGGVEYQTPYTPLRLKLEYDGNDYTRDFAGVPIEAKTPINLGLNYRATDWLDIQASYERGDTFMFGFTARLNFSELTPARVERAPQRPRQSPRYETIEDVRWRRTNERLMRQQVLLSGRYHVREEEHGEVVTLYANPFRYRNPQQMIDRSARVLANDMPESVKTYEIVEQSPFNPVVLTRIDAQQFKAQTRNEDPDHEPADTAHLFERDNTGERPPLGDDGWARGYPYSFTTNYGIRPYFRQDFGSPETFHFYQLGAMLFANRFITEKIEVFGEVGIDIASNYDRFNFNVDHFRSPVPRVRTWVREYLENDVWMERLEANYYERLSDNLYGMVYGGYLERMYAGVGGELLYRQLDQPWAVGIDVTRVRQRDFDGWEGFRDYEQTTGFVSVYYQMPWLEDSQISLHAGQFLAGDRGVNVNFQRRFDSGVIVGAYASFTDVTSEEYGEGSFTKGFFLSIPFDLMGVLPTRQRVSFSWAPMTRDGGQMLDRRARLYGITDARHPFYFR